MSITFDEIKKKAIAVRDQYDDLQRVDGMKPWNAQDRMAGFVGDVGDLSKLVMVKHNVRRGPSDIDAALAHELSDCLWSVVVLTDELGVNLEQAFTDTMDTLHARIEKEKEAA